MAYVVLEKSWNGQCQESQRVNGEMSNAGWAKWAVSAARLVGEDS